MDVFNNVFFFLQIGVPKHTFSHILVFVFFIFILAKIGA